MKSKSLGMLFLAVFACQSERQSTPSEPAPQAAGAEEHATKGEVPDSRATANASESARARDEVARLLQEALPDGTGTPFGDRGQRQPLLLTFEQLVEELGCDRDAAAPISERHAEVLGMLDEYISRFDHPSGEPLPGFIESFYPHERSKADAFELALRNTFARGHEVTRRVGPQGHITLEGQPVADAINAMYMRVPPSGASIDPCKALGWNDAAGRAYLRGMRARFGSPDGQITMANAGAKMTFAAALARKLGLTVDGYYLIETIPTSYHLHIAGLE